MTDKNETPAGKAGVRGDLRGSWSRILSNPSAIVLQFPDHRQAALALLNGAFRLSRSAGKFLGQIAVDPTLLSEKQAAWLAGLLAKHLKPS